jgi:RimJ/RimL family protein N-acetyltransferase
VTPGVRPTLVTERLRLEPLTTEHAEHLVALDGDAEVMRHLTGHARAREEVLDEWLPVLTRDAGPAGVLGYWAGFALGDRQQVSFAGWWGLNPAPEDEREAELGYRLRRDDWGRGLASEGAAALLEHGFATVGLVRVWAQTMAVNTASRRVMERIGMRVARTWVGEWNEPLPGWEQGEVEYEITRVDWAGGLDRG